MSDLNDMIHKWEAECLKGNVNGRSGCSYIEEFLNDLKSLREPAAGSVKLEEIAREAANKAAEQWDSLFFQRSVDNLRNIILAALKTAATNPTAGSLKLEEIAHRVAHQAAKSVGGYFLHTIPPDTVDAIEMFILAALKTEATSTGEDK